MLPLPRVAQENARRNDHHPVPSFHKRIRRQSNLESSSRLCNGRVGEHCELLPLEQSHGLRLTSSKESPHLKHLKRARRATERETGNRRRTARVTTTRVGRRSIKCACSHQVTCRQLPTISRTQRLTRQHLCSVWATTTVPRRAPDDDDAHHEIMIIAMQRRALSSGARPRVGPTASPHGSAANLVRHRPRRCTRDARRQTCIAASSGTPPSCAGVAAGFGRDCVGGRVSARCFSVTRRIARTVCVRSASACWLSARCSSIASCSMQSLARDVNRRRGSW